jgi:phosphoribosylamine--glycine ligase
VDKTPSPASLKILVVGSGGREHALVKVARRSPLVASVIAAPGNGGIAAECPIFSVKADDLPGLVALAQKQNIGFVIVGPEVPLCLGLVDHLAKAGIPAFGPTAAAAILEGSKAFTKTFLLRHQIPTAPGQIFDTVESALAYLAAKPTPIVVKASGLAAGKGVTVAQTRDEAAAAVRAAIEDRVFGDGGDEVLIEDFMPGEEASLLLFVSGQNYLILPAAQDHKRINDGDTGPNTGGMGAYAPAAILTPPLLAQIETTIIRPTLAALVKEGIDYRGILYIGLMLTPTGPQVVEFNVRFGDPECQILLPLLATDPIQLMWQTAHATLKTSSPSFPSFPSMPSVPFSLFSVAIVLSAALYPANPRLGDPITLPATLPPGTDILHAGTTRKSDGTLVTSGGRVLAVTALAPTLRAALDQAYALCAQIHFDGAHYRRDIAARQLNREPG